MKFTLTPAQAALLHVAESGTSSALVTLLVGILQNLTTGKVSLPELATVFGGGFVACLGLVYKSVKNSPALKQAEADTATQIQSYAEKRFNAIEQRLVALFNRLPPPVQQSVETLTTAPYLQAAPAPQQFYAPRPQASATATYAPPPPGPGTSQIAWQPPVLPPTSAGG